jgi:hypothetical protein
MDIWNVRKLIPVHTMQQPGRRPSSYSQLWEPEVIFSCHLSDVKWHLRAHDKKCADASETRPSSFVVDSFVERVLRVCCGWLVGCISYGFLRSFFLTLKMTVPQILEIFLKQTVNTRYSIPQCIIFIIYFVYWNSSAWRSETLSSPRLCR